MMELELDADCSALYVGYTQRSHVSAEDTLSADVSVHWLQKRLRYQR